MSKVIVELLTSTAKNHFSEVGIKVKDEVIKAKEKDGMTIIEVPMEVAQRLFSSEGAKSKYALISPEKIKIIAKRGFGSVESLVLSKRTAKPVKAKQEGPEDEALEVIAKIEEKYEALNWDKEKFVEFCQANEITVPGNWGVARMIKELVKFDSELSVSLEEFRAR
jgi:hypothetical protein